MSPMWYLRRHYNESAAKQTFELLFFCAAKLFGPFPQESNAKGFSWGLIFMISAWVLLAYSYYSTWYTFHKLVVYLMLTHWHFVTHIHLRIRSSSVKAMSWRLFITDRLPELVPIYCQLAHSDFSERYNCDSRKQFENVACNMTAILLRPQCIKGRSRPINPAYTQPITIIWLGKQLLLS